MECQFHPVSAMWPLVVVFRKFFKTFPALARITLHSGIHLQSGMHPSLAKYNCSVATPPGNFGNRQAPMDTAPLAH